jgi:hypothetical protein
LTAANARFLEHAMRDASQAYERAALDEALWLAPVEENARDESSSGSAVGVDGANNGATRPTVSVVIPALNEAMNLPLVLPKIGSAVDEVILVDGDSNDGTREVARSVLRGIRIIDQAGHGKGAALRTGFEAAGGDIIVMLDADGSTDPREIPAFVCALVAGADLAKGSRFVPGGGTADMSLFRRIGNAALLRAVRWLFGGRYTDLCYGYMAFWKRVLPRLDLDADGFEIETQISVKALRSGLKVTEVASLRPGVSTARRIFARCLTDGACSRPFSAKGFAVHVVGGLLGPIFTSSGRRAIPGDRPRALSGATMHARPFARAPIAG